MQDVVCKTSRERWTIETFGKRGSSRPTIALFECVDYHNVHTETIAFSEYLDNPTKFFPDNGYSLYTVDRGNDWTGDLGMGGI